MNKSAGVLDSCLEMLLQAKDFRFTVPYRICFLSHLTSRCGFCDTPSPPPPHPLTLYRQIYRQRSMSVGRTVRSSTCAKIVVEGTIFDFGFSIKFRPFTPFDLRSVNRLMSSIRPICKCPPQCHEDDKVKHFQRPSPMYFHSAEPIRVFSLALISLKSWLSFVLC